MSFKNIVLSAVAISVLAVSGVHAGGHGNRGSKGGEPMSSVSSGSGKPHAGGMSPKDGGTKYLRQGPKSGEEGWSCHHAVCVKVVILPLEK